MIDKARESAFVLGLALVILWASCALAAKVASPSPLEMRLEALEARVEALEKLRFYTTPGQMIDLGGVASFTPNGLGILGR